jgi:hypothetical protein
MRRCRPAVAFFLVYSSGLLAADDGFLSTWFDRSDRAKAGQPHWITPLATVTPRLEQEFRTDFLVQLNPNENPIVNYGNSKGLELIPHERVEFILNVPPYLQHNRPNIHDGFGDASFLGKFRVLSKNEDRGNYIVTVFLAGSIPTGSYTNGAVASVITPTIAAGKGWGKFDFQSTLGAGLPISHAQTIGHAIASNNALQYHVLPQLWPELEINTTFWKGGTQDGKKQVFLTPGLTLGRFKLNKKVAMVFGAGYQIAVTHYHGYNHAAIFTLRFPF